MGHLHQPPDLASLWPFSTQWWPGPTFLQCWAGWKSLPLPVSLPCFPLLSVPPPHPLPAAAFRTRSKLSWSLPQPLHHTPVTLNALWFWNKPLSLAFRTSHDLHALPPPPCLEYPPASPLVLFTFYRISFTSPGGLP